MEALDFFRAFYIKKLPTGSKTERSRENLYGLACGLHAMDTGDFSVLVTEDIAKDAFFYWLDGFMEAVIIKNGNGNMDATVRQIIIALQKSPFRPVSIETLMKRLCAYENQRIASEHFEAFFRCCKALTENMENYALPCIEEALCHFIENDRAFNKVDFFDEVMMPVIKRFNKIFIHNLKKYVNVVPNGRRKNFFHLMLEEFEQTKTAIKYFVHIAKNMEQSERKVIMNYLNQNGKARNFIRVRGVRRLLKQIFGSDTISFNFSHESMDFLSRKQIMFFEKPCKVVGQFKDKVVLEIDKKQHLFVMDRDKRLFLWSRIEKRIKPDKVDTFFANCMI